MAKTRKKRGFSLGSIVMLCITLVTLAMGAAVFVRISGDIGDISLNPDMLKEPLDVLSRSVPEAGGPEDGTPASAMTAGATAEATATAAPTAEPTQPPSRTLSITAAGQISAGEELRTAAQDQATGGLDFSPIFSQLAGAIAGTDLAVATLHTGITSDPMAYGAYVAPAALAKGLSASGFTMLNLATDRLLDAGASGVRTSCDTLQQQGVGYMGAFRDALEMQAPQIEDINGVRIGILAYTTSVSSAGRSAASEAEIAAAVKVFDKETAAADIAALRQAGADIIVALPYWGSRGDKQVTRDMRDTADALVNAGADIILGTGPTSVLEIERRTATGADGQSREVFIAYSLGNFLIDDSRDTSDITGVLLHLTLQWDTQAHRATITEAWYMPTWIMRYRDAEGITRYRIVPAGSATTPEFMQDNVYINMAKAYQSMVNQLGSTHAQPKAEP